MSNQFKLDPELLKYANMLGKNEEQPTEVLTSTDPIDIEGEFTKKTIPPKQERDNEVIEAIQQNLTTPAQKLEDTVSTEIEKRISGGTTTNDWLAGLIPLAVGVLEGDSGVGASGSGEYYTQKYKDDQDMLKEALKLQVEKKNDTRRFQQATIETNDGQIVIGSYDTTNGKMYDMDGEEISGRLIKGFAQSRFTAPETGETILQMKGSGKLSRAKIPNATLGEFNPKQERDLDKVQKSVESNKVYQKSKESLAAAQDAQGLVDSNSPLTYGAIGFKMPRLMGEVGNLTQTEQDNVRGSKNLKDQLNRYYSVFIKDGKLPEKDRKDLSEVLSIFRNLQQYRINKIIKDQSSIGSKKYGIKKKAVEEVLSDLKEQTEPAKKQTISNEDKSALDWIKNDKNKSNPAYQRVYDKLKLKGLL